MRISANGAASKSMRLIALALLIVTGTATGAQADTGIVHAVVTKGRIYHWRRRRARYIDLSRSSYALVFGGMSLGATIDLSTAKLRGHAYHMQKPAGRHRGNVHCDRIRGSGCCRGRWRTIAKRKGRRS